VGEAFSSQFPSLIPDFRSLPKLDVAGSICTPWRNDERTAGGIRVVGPYLEEARRLGAQSRRRGRRIRASTRISDPV
jgi:hypothetical protein